MAARCMVCGRSFIPRGLIGIGPGSMGSISITNVTTQCPYCGGPAKIDDGVYEYANGMLTAVRGLSPESLGALLRLLEQAKGRSTRHQADLLDEIATVAPEIAAIARKALGGRVGLAALLLFIYALVKSCEGGVTINVNAPQIWNETVISAVDASAQKPRHGVSDHSRNGANKEAKKPAAVTPNRHERRKAAAEAKKLFKHRWEASEKDE